MNRLMALIVFTSCTGADPVSTLPLASSEPSLRAATQAGTDQRAAAVASLRALQVTCPYHRAAVQLPIALHAQVAAIPADDLPAAVRADWITLEKEMQAHVAILDALEADLPLPAPGDPLFGTLFPDAPLTRAQLESAPAPVAATMPLLASVPFVVRDADAATKTAIDEHAAVVRAVTADRWPMTQSLESWHATLRGLAPSLVDEAHREAVTAMLDALHHYSGVSC